MADSHAVRSLASTQALCGFVHEFVRKLAELTIHLMGFFNSLE